MRINILFNKIAKSSPELVSWQKLGPSEEAMFLFKRKNVKQINTAQSQHVVAS